MVEEADGVNDGSKVDVGTVVEDPVPVGDSVGEEECNDDSVFFDDGLLVAVLV